MLTRKVEKSHETSAFQRSLDYQIRLKRKAKALLGAQANGKFLDNKQKRVIAQWQQVEQQHRAQEVEA